MEISVLGIIGVIAVALVLWGFTVTLLNQLMGDKVTVTVAGLILYAWTAALTSFTTYIIVTNQVPFAN